LFSSFHCAHFTFSQSHLSDFVWGGILLRDDAFEAALPAFGAELFFLKVSERAESAPGANHTGAQMVSWISYGPLVVEI